MTMIHELRVGHNETEHTNDARPAYETATYDVESAANYLIRSLRYLSGRGEFGMNTILQMVALFLPEDQIEELRTHIQHNRLENLAILLGKHQDGEAVLTDEELTSLNTEKTRLETALDVTLIY